MAEPTDPRARADAWRTRREAAVAAAGSIVVEFRDELHRAFESTPLLETVWTDRLVGRIADLLLQRKLYAFRAAPGAAPAFFVVADSAAAAEAAVATAVRAHPVAAAAWAHGYELAVVEPGDVVATASD